MPAPNTVNTPPETACTCHGSAAVHKRLKAWDGVTEGLSVVVSSPSVDSRSTAVPFELEASEIGPLISEDDARGATPGGFLFSVAPWRAPRLPENTAEDARCDDVVRTRWARAHDSWRWLALDARGADDAAAAVAEGWAKTRMPSERAAGWRVARMPAGQNSDSTSENEAVLVVCFFGPSVQPAPGCSLASG